jgi:hypothetical protein
MPVEANMLIIINHLLESVCFCPKVIPLSGFHCTTMVTKKAIIALKACKVETFYFYNKLEEQTQLLNEN